VKKYPAFVNASTVVDVVRSIIGLRNEDITETDALRNGKLKGRIVTSSREVPANAADVAASDVEGDVVVNATYRYELIDVSGTGLRWHRENLSVGW
jgi:hypothetical protein